MGDFLPHLPPVRDQCSVPGEGRQLNACACCSRAGKRLPLLPSLCAALLEKLLVQRRGHADVDHDQRGPLLLVRTSHMPWGHPPLG